jgi:hypothetical protein
LLFVSLGRVISLLPTSYKKRLSARPSCEAQIELPTLTKLNSSPQYTVAAPADPPDPHPYLSFLPFSSLSHWPRFLPWPQPPPLPSAEQGTGRRRAPTLARLAASSASTGDRMLPGSHFLLLWLTSRAHPLPPAALNSIPPPIPRAKGSRRPIALLEARPRPLHGSAWRPGIGLLLAVWGGRAKEAHGGTCGGGGGRHVEAGPLAGVWPASELQGPYCFFSFFLLDLIVFSFLFRDLIAF